MSRYGAARLVSPSRASVAHRPEPRVWPGDLPLSRVLPYVPWRAAPAMWPHTVTRTSYGGRCLPEMRRRPSRRVVLALCTGVSLGAAWCLSTLRLVVLLTGSLLWARIALALLLAANGVALLVVVLVALVAHGGQGGGRAR